MIMTTEQAADYCRTKAMNVLSGGTPSAEEHSREWNRIRSEVEEDGLYAVESRLYERLNEINEDIKESQGRRTADTSVIQEFLDAINDDEAIKEYIASALKEKVIEEEEKCGKDGKLSQQLYLRFLQDHLTNVVNGSTNLEDYAEAREEIETQLRQYEEEYGKWIEDAIAAQDD